MIRIAGLFAGIGGLDLGIAQGLEACGEEVGHKAFVEWAPFPQQVLAQRFPGVPMFSDIREVSGDDLGEPDVLVGGFPCQDISAANKDAAGLAGARSGLWTEQRRLIGETRAPFVVIENVYALIGRGLWKVLNDLHQLGYVAQYDVLTAHSVGAPHQRERVFILAQRLDAFGGNLALFTPRDTGLWAGPYPEPWAEHPAAVVEQVKALGNAVSPPVAAVVGEALSTLWAHGQPAPHAGGVALDVNTDLPRAGYMDSDGLLHKLPSSTRRATRDVLDVAELELQGSRDDRRRELAARIAARRLPTPTATDWKGGGIGGAWHRNLKQGMGGTPSPRFLEWVMGFPQHWTDLR